MRKHNITMKFWRQYSIAHLGYNQPNARNKQLILSVLNSTATKREARDYLKKYTDETNANHCLVFVRDLLSYDHKTLSKFGQTVKRLKMLGLRPMFVIPPTTPKLILEESGLLDKLLSERSLKTTFIPDLLTKKFNGEYKTMVSFQSDNITSENIPIIQPYIYDESTSTRFVARDKVDYFKQLITHIDCKLDKIFILNKYGGLPSGERHDNAHVFVNISQEFDSLKNSLQKEMEALTQQLSEKATTTTSKSKSLEAQDNDSNGNQLIDKINLFLCKDKLQEALEQYTVHLEDLCLMETALSVLSHYSTGVITTVPAAGILTRNNPLLYNVLTDRSLISSSLPRFKRESKTEDAWYELPMNSDTPTHAADDAVFVTTVLKKGINITMFDYSLLTQENSIGLPNMPLLDRKSTPKPDLPSSGKSALARKLDLNKLKAIIDQSFGRSLDLSHYLNRINGRIASIIVIGDYEGIAILTYEGTTDRPFVYLDKFAVMPHLKGSLGISDIIFNLMFKKFPNELLWRSRKDNVVNKWYFQRSVGVLDLAMNLGDGDQKPSTFKLFYYGDPAKNNGFDELERLREYAFYVRDIQPSWES